MFSLGWDKLLILAVIGLIVFGPERLPQVAREARDLARQLIKLARSAKDELQAELGPEMADLDLASLHPRRIVRDALALDDDLPSTVTAAATPVIPARMSLRPGERPPWDIDAT